MAELTRQREAMADLVLTAALIIPSAAAEIARGLSGATILRGNTLFKDTDNKMKLCDANGASPLYKFAGIALVDSSAGQPVLYVTKDPSLALGTGSAGDILITSGANPGGIAPHTDVAAGMFVTTLGVMTANGVLNFAPSTAKTVKA